MEKERDVAGLTAPTTRNVILGHANYVLLRVSKPFLDGTGK